MLSDVADAPNAGRIAATDSFGAHEVLMENQAL